MTVNSKKKYIPLVILVILLAGTSLWFVWQRRSSAPAIRHVVLISLDTCRADRLSCYGYARPTTPHIDALARQGTVFGSAMTPIPLTLPAHASMLTGMIPPHHGKRENRDLYFDPTHVTLAALLKTKGYHTGAFVGSQILNARFGLNRGFDTYHDRFGDSGNSERRGEEVNRAALAWLEQQNDRSVFLFLHYYDPHDAYEPPEPFATTFKEDPYAGEIAYTDHCIGQVVATLKRLGMYESSLIVVTSDHGEMLGEHGETTHMYFIYQSAMKVPLVCKLPGSHAARTVDDLVSIVDIVPTVCDLLDIPAPAGIQGKTLAPYFSPKPPQPEDRYLYCESLYPTKYQANSLLGVIGKQWKYIQTTRPELFDLQQDPNEEMNRVESQPDQARVLKDYLAQVLAMSLHVTKPPRDTPLDAESLRHLRSLGYVAGASVNDELRFDQDRTDPKDLIGFHNEYLQVMSLVEQGNVTEGRTRGERLVKQYPGIYVLCDLLSATALKQKDFEGAIRHGERALALEPGRFKVHYNLGLAYSRSQHTAPAAEHLGQALELMPKNQTVSLTDRVEAHWQLGGVYVRQKKFDLAIVQFQEALTLDPQQPHMLNTLAWLLATCPDQTLRDPGKALQLAKKACALTQSKHPPYLNTLAVAYARLKNFSEAIKTSERALALAQAKGDQAVIATLQNQLDRFKRALTESK